MSIQIHLIWAQDKNGGIGKNGKLPWHISEDLKNFKKLTLNSTILMGRNTWESLPLKPLPYRRNIVLTSKPIVNVETYNSITDCFEVLYKDGIEEIYIIGGSQLYSTFIHNAIELHITLVNIQTEGIDIYFPTSIRKIKKKFKKIEEIDLQEKAKYTHWIRK